MEWREQSAVGCEEAYLEAQRWIEAVTKKKFGTQDFRSALENGILLCDLINKIKPGIVKKVNRLPTPIAGLDNLNVFLKACGRLGLKEAQLFHPGDLQDLSTRVTVQHQETNRRLKNVLITIYWLGRRAQCDRLYDGPYLNFKAFEGLLGTALYKALHETSSPKGGGIRDSGFGDSWYPEREEHHRPTEEGGGGHKRDDSLDSLDSLGSQPPSISSDATLKGSSEGCCSDTDADAASRMANYSDNASYRRSVSITPKTTAPFNQFLPTKDKTSGYVPAPLRRKRADRNEDNRRSLGSVSYIEDEDALTRQQQTPESIDGSKSTSDLQVDTKLLRQRSYEEWQKHREKMKEVDDKWQDDLSKWKSRRRSVNSDMVKKKEEREKIEQITYGSGNSNRRSKTFKEMQEGREHKGRLSSLSYLDNEDVFEAPVASPRTRTLPDRSYTIDTPYYSSDADKPSLKEKLTPPAPSATGRAASPHSSREVDVFDGPAGSDPTTTSTSASRSRLWRSQSPAAAPLRSSPASERASRVKTEERTTIISSSSSSSSSAQKASEPRYPLSRTQAAEEVPSSGSLYKQQPQPSSMEPKPPAVSRVSASLPRSYQRAESARLSSVVAPRPFGTQSSRISSLPRASTMDDATKRVNGEANVPKRSSVPSRYQQFMTSEDEASSQTSSAHSSEDEEEEEEKEVEKKGGTTVRSITSTHSVSPVKTETLVSTVPAKETLQENHCEMRISLNQKPNSSKDFGFEAAWDSTGARVTSVQPGSQAEMCQLRAGDEVLTVNRHQVAEMSYTDWKSCMDGALQEGSLVMDIRRHGKNSSPDTKPVNSSLDFTSRSPKEPLAFNEASTHQVIDVASNGVNGGCREEPLTARNKESESISLKNLKRRSEFFEQGGPEAMMPEITVPPIAPSVSRWSWDPEEERKRQEKWQKEQERLLQEKYKRDQEKLQEEWLKAQQEISTSGDQQESWRLEVKSRSISPRSPLSPLSQPSSPLWEQEERKRREEQERQRQAEERRRQEEEERELQRLQEERKRKERQEEEERRRREEEEEEEERRQREEEELRWQRRREEERAEQLRRERERALEQQQWAKSKSSPQLDEEEKTSRKVTSGEAGDRKGQQSVTQAEAERQQILNEMKKKTPLLTDSSWIRQRPAPTVKESDIPPMRRGESLDGLDSSWRSSWNPNSDSYIQNSSRPHSALPSNSSFYGGGPGVPRPQSSTLPSSYSMGSLRGGAGTPPSYWSQQSRSSSASSSSPATSPEPPQQRSRSVSGKKICTFCETPLGKGAAMIIESLGLCYHLGCFKCFDCKSDLGGSRAGAEVRIRNKQLYCNLCYMQFKTGQPTAM